MEKRWRKGFTLTLEGDRRVFRSSISHPEFTSSFLLNSFWEEWQARFQMDGEDSAPLSSFPLFFGIREKVVPVGMKDLLVSILDLEKPYGEGNFLSLEPQPERG